MNSADAPRFFDIEKNVKEYIAMREGLDGRYLIDILRNYLKSNSTILELGMGPGMDLDILRGYFEAAGSDASGIFIDLYKKDNPNADVLVLDAASLETDRKFDCLFSNKVLHHLTRDQLEISFSRQYEILNDRGLLFHTFWEGDAENEYLDLRFIKYRIPQLVKATSALFELLESGSYAEMNLNDSFYLIMRKRS
ncbi:MAG: class I SAM-dependent methyltransferase [Acidobacteria bacterium]|nr:class I SAM-dependent methyltransferase [Acidobacteriota bacterium]